MRRRPRFGLGGIAAITALCASFPAARGGAFDATRMRADGVVVRPGSYYPYTDRVALLRLDVDGNGVDDAIVVRRQAWFVLTYEPSTKSFLPGSYQQRPSGDEFVSATLGDFDGDGRVELAVLTFAGDLRFFDPKSGVLLSAQRVLRLRWASAITAADLDPAVGDEILIRDDETVALLRRGGTTARWEVTLPAGSWGAAPRSLLVGNVDGDPALEVVATTYAGIAVIDTASLAVDWPLPSVSARALALGDVDGDGRDELLVDAWSTWINLWDLSNGTSRWPSTPPRSSEEVALTDLDGDGAAEVQLRSGSEVTVLDGKTGTERWRQRPVDGLFVAGDFDGDCARDAVPDDQVALLDLASRSWIWRSRREEGVPIVAFGDLDADGRNELVHVGSLGVGRLQAADLPHARELFSTPIDLPDLGVDSRGQLLLGQLDADPPLEYVIAVPNASSGRAVIAAFDGTTHVRQWTSPSPAPTTAGVFTGMQIADVDRDGSPEVVVGVGRGDTPVMVLSGVDGQPAWTSPLTSSDTRDLRVADIDGDGDIEIVYYTYYDVVVLDGKTLTQNWSLAHRETTAMTVGDFDGDGDLDIALGNQAGELTVIDGISESVIVNELLTTRPFYRMELIDLDRDGKNELVVLAPRGGVTTEVEARIYETSTRRILWTSPPLEGTPRGELASGDVDDDGKLELAVAGGHAVHVYEYDPGSVDTTPPTFRGAIGVQGISKVNPGCCSAVDLSWNPADDDASPPVQYLVYRDRVAGFTPSFANLLVRTPLPSYRDAGVAGDSDYFYVVRAVDRLDNADANRIEAGVHTDPGDSLPGPQGNVLHAFRTGADVILDYASAPAARFGVYRDEDKTDIGVTTLPPDTTLTRYVDVAAVGGASLYFYDLRGLAVCSGSPGPR